MNRCLETYLRCFVGGQPRKWVQWLSWAEGCFNISYHSSTKTTPFELVYGYPPPLMQPYEVSTARLESVEQKLREMDNVLYVLKSNLEMAQNRMKLQTDKKMTERHFEVGDMVYLRLVPYQLQSLAPHSYHKLQPRFFGPYKVLEKVGTIAYKLQLPPETKVHSVFQVSCLKKQLGNNVIPSPTLPLSTEDGLQLVEPAAILNRMMYKKGMVAGYNSWCNGKDKMLSMLLGRIMRHLRLDFQNLQCNLEDKISFEGGSIVMIL